MQNLDYYQRERMGPQGLMTRGKHAVQAQGITQKSPAWFLQDNPIDCIVILQLSLETAFKFAELLSNLLMISTFFSFRYQKTNKTGNLSTR